VQYPRKTETKKLYRLSVLLSKADEMHISTYNVREGGVVVVVVEELVLVVVVVKTCGYVRKTFTVLISLFCC